MITKISGPSSGEIWPVYNPVDFVFNSDNVSETNFKYVVEIFPSGGTVSIYQTKVNSATYGVVQLSNVLKDLVSYDWNLSSWISDADNSCYAFDIQVGEEYEYEFSFFQAYSYGLHPLQGKLALSCGGFPNIILNDNVNISGVNYGDDRDNINGVHRVIATGSINPWLDIVLDMEYDEIDSVGSGITISGYGDVIGTNVTNKNLLAINNVRIFNGVLDWVDFKNYNPDDYSPRLGNTDGLLLTDIPMDDSSGLKSISVGTNSQCFINVNNVPISGTASNKIEFRRYDGAGSLTGVFRSNTYSTSSANISRFRCGLGNLPPLNVVSGSLPLFDGTMSYYEVCLNYNTTNVSESIRFNLDKRCVINDIEVLFLDRLGSVLPMLFSLRKKKNNTINNDKYKISVGAGQTYEISDGNEGIWNVDLDEVWTINSNWMDDVTSVLFEELFTSKFSLIKGIFDDGLWYSFTIINSSVVIERQKNKRLIQYSLDIRLIKNKVNI